MSDKTTAELFKLARHPNAPANLRDMAAAELARRNAGNKAVL